jgi:hypothetical protein
MFVYNTSSYRSLDSILNYPNDIRRLKQRISYPVMIVGYNQDGADQKVLLREGMMAALDKRCAHCHASEGDPRSIENAFFHLVRAGWTFEQEDCAEKRRQRMARKSKSRQHIPLYSPAQATIETVHAHVGKWRAATGNLHTPFAGGT